MSAASYPVQIKHIDKAMADTVRIYQDAVAYLIDIVTLRFDDIKDMSDLAARKHIEELVHGTSKRPAAYKTFDRKFYCLMAFPTISYSLWSPKVPVILSPGLHHRCHRSCEVLAINGQELGRRRT